MNEDRPDMFEKGQPGADDDWENRVLCSDGNCIGVIGPDGHCKECGKPYEGELPEPNQNTVEQTDAGPSKDKPDENNNDQDIDEEDTDLDAVDEADYSDWESRVLCSDGNCIGVIGPNGRCKECGKPYKKGADE